MVKVHAVFAGRTWSILVLSSIRKREGDVENEQQLALKEGRSKKFKSHWIEDQVAKGNAYLWPLGTAHKLLAIDEEAVAYDLKCSSLSMMKTISRRFHSFTLSKRETLPEAFDTLEKHGFKLEKPKMGSTKDCATPLPQTPKPIITKRPTQEQKSAFYSALATPATPAAPQDEKADGQAPAEESQALSMGSASPAPCAADFTAEIEEQQSSFFTENRDNFFRLDNEALEQSFRSFFDFSAVF
eukprot:m51a1_g3306 hypothetical protein (242) ;mRNA; f:323843-324755